VRNERDTRQIRTLIRANPHWIYLVKPFVYMGLGTAPMIVGAAIMPGSGDPAAEAIRITLGASAFCCGAPFFVGGAVLLLLTLWGMARWHLTLTTEKFSVARGYIGRRSDEIYIRQIESVSVRKGLIGALLNYGEIVVRGSGGTPIKSVMVSRPDVIRDRVREVVMGR